MTKKPADPPVDTAPILPTTGGEFELKDGVLTPVETPVEAPVEAVAKED